MMAVEKKLLTVREVAAEFGLGEGFVRRLVREHKIPHVRPGHRTLLFERAEVQRWIAEHRVEVRT